MADRTFSVQRGGQVRVWSSPEDRDVCLLSVDAPVTAFTPDEVMQLMDGLTQHYGEFVNRQPPTMADVPDEEWCR